MSIIFFEPVYQPRVWGGRALADRLGRRFPGSEPFGESWEIVDRPEAQSVDRHIGCILRELLQSDADSIMGPSIDDRSAGC